jgi:hypothetical protein
MEKNAKELNSYSYTSIEVESFLSFEDFNCSNPITSSILPDNTKYSMEELHKYNLKYVAEFVHYCYYVPEEHPKSSQYNNPTDMIQKEYADLIGFETTDILNFIVEKLEENKNSKSILVKTLFNLVRSAKVELSEKTKKWLKEMFRILSQNEYGKLPIFPVMELYESPLIYKEPNAIICHPPVYVDNCAKYSKIIQITSI